MFQLPTQSRSVIAVFKDSFKLFKDVFVRCLPWAILISILQIINHAATTTSGESRLYLLHHYPLLSILCNLLTFLVTTYLIYQILHFMRQEKPSFKDIISKGTIRGLLGLVSYLVFIFIAMVVCALIYGVLHFIPTLGPLLTVLIIIVGSVYLVINLICWIPLIVDGKKPVAAFRESFQLVKNNWWRTFGLLILLILLVYVFTTIIALLTGIHLFPPADPNQQLTKLNYIGLFILPIFTTPWSLSVVLLQMHNLQLAQAEKQA